MIEAAIFDMDGVLLDNLEYHLKAFQSLGREEGRRWHRRQILDTFGRRNRDMLESLFGRALETEESERLAARKEELYRHLIAPELEASVVPGLRTFLNELADAGLGIALATSGPPENVELVLDELRIRPYFQTIVTGNEVRNGKPDPEIFLLAADRLGAAPSGCLVFEDSKSGILAALRANCRCAALTTTHSRRELRELSPHLILDDFTGITMACLSQL